MNAILPRGRLDRGSCGLTTRSLPSNSYSPATRVSGRSFSGSSSLRLSLPWPLALIGAVKPAVMRRTGLCSMNLRKSAVAPRAIPAHLELRAGIAQPRDADLDVGERRAEDAAAAPGDVHALALEEELALDVLDARPAFRVLQQPRSNARRDAELPRPGSTNGNSRRSPWMRTRTSLEWPASMPLTSHSRVFSPPIRRAVRQVARELRRVGAVELGREVDRARSAGHGLIGAVRVAAEMRVGKRERRDAQRDAGIASRSHSTRPFRKSSSDARLGKHARQVELAFPRWRRPRARPIRSRRSSR